MLVCWYVTLASLWLGSSCALQLTPRVRTASQGPLPIRPWGRTFFSTDPAESAKFVATYFKNASLVALPTCRQAQQAIVSISLGEQSVSMVFVKSDEVAGGSLSIHEVIKNKTAQVGAVFRGSRPYVPWIDNHDGWDLTYLDAAKVVEDGIKAQVYSDGAIIVRLDIPHTLWTLEFAGKEYNVGDDSVLQALLEKYLVHDPDLCRIVGMPSPSPSTNWRKATFMSANMSAAARWASAVLGARQAVGAYPWPPKPDCEAALWMNLPGGMFSLHFVLSVPYSQGMKPTLDSLAAHEESAFDRYAIASSPCGQYLHNSLILTVDSLDPYLQRLRANDFPFVFVRSGSKYVVFADIPGNGITVQLRSQHASIGQPKRWEMCECQGVV